jgi:hypothetical protein
MSNTSYAGNTKTTVGSFTYGYSDENDNSADSTNKTISVDRSEPVKVDGEVHSMTVTVTKCGFTKEQVDANKPQSNVDATKVKFNKMEGGIVEQGTNSVSATANGITYTATVPEIPSKYVISNFGNTSESNKS